MKIFIDDQLIQEQEYDKNSFGVFWDKTVDAILLQNRYIYEIQINDITYYDNVESVRDHISNEIKTVKISTITSRDNLEQLLQTLSEYVPNYLNQIRSIAVCFYSELEEIHWRQFSVLMEGLDWLIKSLNFSIILINQSKCFGEYEETFYSILRMLEPQVFELEKVLTDQDYTAVGDLLQYEITPLIEQLNLKIT